jgi:SP family general alpha glucoside:H+ symporter-like MFS transporter
MYVLASEVGSAQLRQKTISIARSTYYATLVINSVVAPYMLNPTKGNLKGKAAFPAAAFLIGCLVWGFFRLPETKDRSFEELDILFGASLLELKSEWEALTILAKKVPARQFKEYQITEEDHRVGHIL